jgi:hypothetical protein
VRREKVWPWGCSTKKCQVNGIKSYASGRDLESISRCQRTLRPSESNPSGKWAKKMKGKV